ncbi:unnamed protein product [Protopolystoma xenopodis]|uniref:Uncharacterized protein n=1 Tax=Protopolystoma xenopodis TaxID=117903 RepID=A0A3S5B2V6_9PLAT|nr:unnamed protein product [Protopolystoma xenopodis]
MMPTTIPAKRFENLPSPLSDAGNHDNYYDRRLRTRGVLLSRPDNKTKLRQRVTTVTTMALASVGTMTAILAVLGGRIVTPVATVTGLRTWFMTAILAVLGLGAIVFAGLRALLVVMKLDGMV